MRQLKHIVFFILQPLLLPMLCSCDEGDIIEEFKLQLSDGYAVAIEGQPQGLDSWPEGYNMAVAGFAQGDSFPAIAKQYNSYTTKDGVFTLNSIPENVSTIEVCVLSSINKRMATIKKLIDVDRESGNIEINQAVTFNAADIDCRMFTALQNNIFTRKCAGCHGQGEKPAAGLYLTEGKSYENLYKKLSAKDNTTSRVEPSDAENSMLYKVLSTEAVAGVTSWHYDHSKFCTESELKIIKDWINSGAENQ